MSVPARLLGLLSRRARGWPLETAAARGRALGRLVWRLDRRHRGVALANLRRAFPERHAGWRRRVARAAFEQLGRTAMEMLWSPAATDRELCRIVDIDGAEHLVAALESGRGAILATGHFGNWELVGVALGARGIPLRSVARPLDDADLDRLLTDLRTRTGSRLIPKGRAVRGSLEALRDGDAVAILTDQNTLRDHAVFVPFFDHPAATSPLVAQLHLRTGAPVLPAFAVPRDGGYELLIEPPLEPRASERRQAVMELTATVTDRVEHRIRERPEAWLWMHDRWRTRPTAEAAGS